MKDGRKKKTNEGKKSNARKKSRIMNCQIGISFVLGPSLFEQLSS